MKAIFKVLACAAALSFFVACGPSVSGNPQEDAKAYMELVNAKDVEGAAEYLKAVVAEYGATEKYTEFCKAAGIKATNDAMNQAGDMMEDFGEDFGF